MAYESFYEGGYSSLNSEYGRMKDPLKSLQGVNIKVGSLSMVTDPRTANQLGDVATKLNTGVKNIEVSVINPEIFDSVPEQHLQEINRMSKLVGADVTVHGLLVEPSGITDQNFSEAGRENTERQMLMNVERAATITPGGIITFHSTVQAPEAEEKVMVMEDGKMVEKLRSAFVIDSRTGRMASLKDVNERFLPREKGEKFTGEAQKFDPKLELDRINKEGWTDELRKINFNADQGITSLRSEKLLSDEEIKKIETGKASKEEVFKQYGEWEEQAKNDYYHQERAVQQLRTAYREMHELFDLAYKKAKEEAEKKGDKMNLEKMNTFAKNLDREKIEDKEKFDTGYLTKTVQEGTKLLQEVGSPQYYVPLKDFLLDKSSTTFGDVAFKAYDKLHEKAPTISIENPPAGGGLSRAEDIRDLVQASRKKFVESAVKNGYSEKEAEETAKKMIGATWDVGHINMLKKFGYTDKDLIKQAEIIAPFVKHVHLSDNFGMSHTELPMGMGNVPFKKELEKIEAEGFKGKQVIEVGNWWQHFRTAPMGEMLEALGSPLYSMQMGPYWNQVRSIYGNYFSGYGPILPDQHFSMYGTGFTSLPQELGGQIPGRQSRFSGTPNE